MISVQVYLFELVRLSIGLTLLIAAYHKYLDLKVFRSELVDSFGVSHKVSHWLAPAIVCTELILAVLTLSPHPIQTKAMAASLALFMLFTLVLLWHVFSGNLLRCSCFGKDDRPVSLFDLMRNGLIIVLLSSYLSSAPTSVSLSLPTQALLFALACLMATILSHFHDVMVSLIVAFRRTA